MATQSVVLHSRNDNGGLTNRHKELTARHQELQQNKDKVEGTLISILLLTQITELKMLIDIGRHAHRLYDIVLALLVVSAGALIVVGLIVLYVGNLRYYRRSRRATRTSHCFHVGETGGITRCSACCCIRRRRGPTTTTTVATSKGSRLSGSYVCVPLGVVNAAESGRSTETIRGGAVADTIVHVGQSTASIAAVGCCSSSSWPDDIDAAGVRHEPHQSSDADLGCNRLDLLDAAFEDARSKLSAVNARIATLKAEYDMRKNAMTRKSTLDHPSSDASRSPLATHLYDDVTDDDTELAACRRQKEAIEAELCSIEARRQRAVAAQLAIEENEEKAVFRAVMFWQHFTMYVLYFVCLMNIFITAFGIYNSSSSSNNNSSISGDGTP